jgi:transposase-like protein
MSTQLHDAATWPRSVRQHIEAIAATLMLGLQVFRERAMNLGGSLAAITSSDAKDEKIRRLESELELHRRRFIRIPAKSRPHFAPEDRLAILRLAWINGWSAQDVAQRLLLNVSTVRRWMRMWEQREDPGVFFGKPAWNRLSDAVRDLIHDCACTSSTWKVAREHLRRRFAKPASRSVAPLFSAFCARSRHASLRSLGEQVNG